MTNKLEQLLLFACVPLFGLLQHYYVTGGQLTHARLVHLRTLTQNATAPASPGALSLTVFKSKMAFEDVLAPFMDVVPESFSFTYGMSDDIDDRSYSNVYTVQLHRPGTLVTCLQNAEDHGDDLQKLTIGLFRGELRLDLLSESIALHCTADALPAFHQFLLHASYAHPIDIHILPTR